MKDKRLQGLENLANGIESNVYTSCVINIYPEDVDNVRWATKTIEELTKFKTDAERLFQRQKLGFGEKCDIKEVLMKVIKNKDEMSACNNCLDRQIWAQAIIVVGGMSIKLCETCRKEMMKQLIDKF